jgi:tetratricopeptide (TPR) repeat protein
MVSWLLALSLAVAQEPKADVELSDTVSGRRVRSIDLPDGKTQLVQYEDEKTGKYPKRIYDGARWLQMSVDFVWSCWEVMNHLYLRDYKGLHGVLQKVKEQYPDSGVAPVGRALMWQVLMLENFDFKYEMQYKNSFETAVQDLQRASVQPGNDAWENFLMGAILGVDAIHELRKEDFLDAINQGYEAMKFIEIAKRKAQFFVDSQLGDGLWLYWRSLIASNVPGVPIFTDERAKGIEMMQLAERESVFLRPAASHALVYTWIEERKMKTALMTAQHLQDAYPNNVINLQVLGRVQMYEKQYKEAEKSFQRVLLLSPKNERSHFYLARLYMRTQDYPKAESHIDTYLTFDLSDYHKAYGQYFKGHIHYRQKQYQKAKLAYDKAWEINKVKGSKERSEMAAKKLAERK